MTLMHPSTIWLYLAQIFTQDVLNQLFSLLTADCTTGGRGMLEERVAALLEEEYRELDFRFQHLGDGTATRLRLVRA
jgi:hypothetical protein